MPRNTNSPGFVSIFTLFAVLSGSVTGVAVGLALGSAAPHRSIALAASLVAVLLFLVLRFFFGEAFPRIFMKPRGPSLPGAIWVSAVFSILVGALAGHDLSQLATSPEPPFVGFFSGTIATLSIAVLMVLYFYNHPEEGVEF